MLGCTVVVTIQNKSEISDPEGTSILNNLVLRYGNMNVSSIRTAKTLKFTFDLNLDNIEDRVRQMCDDLHIYNPLISTITIKKELE